jgi:hypothetical protein
MKPSESFGDKQTSSSQVEIRLAFVALEADREKPSLKSVLRERLLRELLLRERCRLGLSRTT